LVDERVVPEDLHGADRAGEAGGDIGGYMHGRREDGIVIGSRDGDSARAGEGGSEVVRGGSGSVGVDDGDGSDGEEKDDGEDYILDEAALGAGGWGDGHRDTHKYASGFFRQKTGFYLGVF